MVPPDESLRACYFPCHRIDNRLIICLEFSLGERIVNLRNKPSAVHIVVAHFLVAYGITAMGRVKCIFCQFRAVQQALDFHPVSAVLFIQIFLAAYMTDTAPDQDW